MSSATARVFQIRSSVFGGKKQLSVEPGLIETSTYLQEPLRISIEELDGFRYGVNAFRIFLLPFSQTYEIDLRGGRKLIRIRFYGFFGIGNRKARRQCQAVLDAMSETFVPDLCRHYARLISEGFSFRLGTATLGPKGIQPSKNGSAILWRDAELKEYQTYCAIFDRKSPESAETFYYWHDWNTSILRAMTRWMIESHRRHAPPTGRDLQ